MDYSYTYNLRSDSFSDSIAVTLLMVYAICVVVGGLVSLAAYILRGIGFYTIAKSQGDDNAWLAFIPFARKYQQGELAGDILLKTKSIQKTGIWFVGLPIVKGVLSYLIGMVMGIAIVGGLIRYGNYGMDLEDMIGSLLGFLLIYVLIEFVYQIFYKILVILVDMKILSRLTTGNMPLIHSIFCAVVPLYEAICFFVMSRRLKEDVPPGREYTGGMDYNYEMPVVEENENPERTEE